MRIVRALGIAVALTLALGACGSAKKADAPAATTPEQATTSAAVVATGLTEITSIAGDIATQAGSDKAAAQASFAKIEPIWLTIEGTVKANNPNAYVSFEDAFSALETASTNGDAAKAADGSARVAAAVTAYLATYPG